MAASAIPAENRPAFPHGATLKKERDVHLRRLCPGFSVLAAVPFNPMDWGVGSGSCHLPQPYLLPSLAGVGGGSSFIHSTHHKEITMPIENFLLPALETVLDWDLAGDVSGQALWQQAGLLACVDPEQGSWSRED